jgi:hypothetical protein
MKKHKKVKIKRKVMRKKMNKHSKHIKIKPKNKEIIRIVKPQKRSVTISKKIENVDKTKSPETETKYTLEVDGAKVTVEIKKEENSYTYNLNVPKFSVGTESLLRYIKNELISSATISVQELSEQESFFKMKQ